MSVIYYGQNFKTSKGTMSKTVALNRKRGGGQTTLPTMCLCSTPGILKNKTFPFLLN